MTLFAVPALLATLALQSPAQPQQEPLSELTADLVLTATVHFDAIRFDAVGTPKVAFTGTLIDRSEWTAERINLPDIIQPGTTYRNAGVKFRILATFKDADAFLKALLEEPKKGGGR